MKKSILVSTPVRWDIAEQADGSILGTCMRLGITATGANYDQFMANAQVESTKFFKDLYNQGNAAIHSFCFSHGLVYNIVEISRSVDVYANTVVIEEV
jgi:hypothetical protein